MSRESKIGIFVLIGLAAMVYIVMRTGDLARLFGQEEAVREVGVVLDDASGMRKGTNVEIAGVKVGEVIRIELEDDRAVAVIGLPMDLVLKEGASASLKSKGVLGERYVALNPGVGDPAADQDRLLGKAPPDLGEITSTIKQLGENLLEITESIKASTLTSEGNNRVAKIAENVEKLSAVLVEMLAENRSNMQTTSTEIAALSASLNREVPALVSELTTFTKALREMASNNRGNIDQTASNVAELTENIKRASDSLSSITHKIDEGQGSLGKLVNESETSDKLNTLLDTANESLAQVKGLVDRAVKLDLDLLLRSQYHAEQGGTKTMFGIRIKPNPDKYYLLEGVTLSSELETIGVNEVTETMFNADGELIGSTLFSRPEEPDDFLFNGLLAYKVGGFFLRGGVIESEVGGGIDYRAFENRFELTIDAFDFSRDNDLSPHARFDIRYNVGHGIHLNAGWDDFLESDKNSAVFGGGINWKDEDLKILFANMGKFF